MFEAHEHNEQRLTPETEALIANGLDFLNKAREELEAGQAKFSVVSFWTAVEILMKVPLVQEHWTLACSGKKMDRKKYIAGDFQSVTYDEACSRLGDVLEKPLPQETALLFNKVKNHRNRVVHFFHNELSEGFQQQVMTEQADAWFALNRLMYDEWSSLFGWSLRSKLTNDEARLLRSSEFYAGAKFRDKSVQLGLASELQDGAPISKCHICSYDSMVKRMLISDISLYDEQCLVCNEQNVFVDLACPRCSKVVKMETGDSDFRCDQCDYESSRYHAFSFAHSLRLDEKSAAGCANCSRPDSVCFYPSIYTSFLCTACFNTHELVYQCAHCSHLCADESGPGSNEGCMFCRPENRIHQLNLD